MTWTPPGGLGAGYHALRGRDNSGPLHAPTGSGRPSWAGPLVGGRPSWAGPLVGGRPSWAGPLVGVSLYQQEPQQTQVTAARDSSRKWRSCRVTSRQAFHTGYQAGRPGGQTAEPPRAMTNPSIASGSPVAAFRNFRITAALQFEVAVLSIFTSVGDNGDIGTTLQNEPFILTDKIYSFERLAKFIQENTDRAARDLHSLHRDQIQD